MPLISAVKSKNFRKVRRLINDKADVNQCIYDEHGRKLSSPLVNTIYSNNPFKYIHMGICVYLIKKGSKLNECVFTTTILFHTIDSGYYKIVMYLIKKGVNLNIINPDRRYERYYNVLIKYNYNLYTKYIPGYFNNEDGSNDITTFMLSRNIKDFVFCLQTLI